MVGRCSRNKGGEDHPRFYIANTIDCLFEYFGIRVNQNITLTWQLTWPPLPSYIIMFYMINKVNFTLNWLTCYQVTASVIMSL